MGLQLCEQCGGRFPSPKHPCAAVYLKENLLIQEDLRKAKINQTRFIQMRELLRKIAENLECAGYKLGSQHDPDAAKAFQFELGMQQHRAERLATIGEV